MPQFVNDSVQISRDILADKKNELADIREEKQRVSAQHKSSFTPEGAITRAGLEAELLRLDVIRRSKNPLDGGEQALIQGQQNEIALLLQLEANLLKKKENIISRIQELERETQELINSLERRSTNDA